MVQLIMTIGLPASGKTDWAHRQDGFVVLSSDDIRTEFGDVNDQKNNVKVFQVLHDRVKHHLLNGQSCIFDATNLNCKKRRSFLREIGDIDCEKIAVVFIAPLEILRERNENRDRKVPGYVFANMIKNFQPPIYEEGWNSIRIIKYDGDFDDPLADVPDMDQENKHHSLTLLEHSERAERYIKYKYPDREDLAKAAYYHDNGKHWTKGFIDSKGYPCNQAHFYGHDSYGAYMYLLNPGRNEDLRISALIAHHMRPYIWNEHPHVKEKDMQWMGEFGRDLEILYEADVEAH